MTLGPRLEDVLGPLAAVIVREVEALGEATVADVVDVLHRTQPRQHAYTTVMTIMSRLHDRGVMSRTRRGRQYVYAATAREPELIDRLSGLAIDQIVDRFGAVALRHFAVRLADLDPATRDRLVAVSESKK